MEQTKGNCLKDALEEKITFLHEITQEEGDNIFDALQSARKNLRKNKKKMSKEMRIHASTVELLLSSELSRVYFQTHLLDILLTFKKQLNGTINSG